MKKRKLIMLLALMLSSQLTKAQDFTHYLLAYFTGNSVEQEQIRYATSTNGTTFEALNGEQPVISSSDISLSGGVRDPFIVRGHDDGYFYMCVTDMKSSLGWSSNRGLTILRSKDLINWEHHIFHFPTLFATTWSDVTRVWAPEIIWDEAAQKYLTYYSLLSNSMQCDKLYYSYINFDDDPEKWTITEPKDLYCYKENGVEKATIDANIVTKDGLYYMFFKTEDSEKRIRLHHSTSLTDWSNASTAVVAQNPGEAEEGACCFQLIGEQKWIFMSDLYGRSTATFRQRTTTDFVTFTQIGNLSGVSPRHGSVIWLTEDETNRLNAWSTLQQMLNENKDLCDAEEYQNAVAAIKTGDTQKMLDATTTFEAYLKSQNIGATLRNGNFDNGTSNWTYWGNCVAGGDSRNPCVEAFNCDFDFYQTLTGLENGFYKLSVQAFQRPRSNSGEWTDYQNGINNVKTWIYMNDSVKAVKDVFDEATYTAYTWGTPYTNSDGKYTPDNMATASEAFSRGMYENAMGIEVKDGTLTVGIKSNGGTSSSRWSIFDNFRLEKTDTLYYEGEKKGDDDEPEEETITDTCSLNINTDIRGAKVEKTQYGIFYEEINHAGDGGLYAELVRNRAFAEGTDYWHATGTNTLTTLSFSNVNSAQTAHLSITNKVAGEGVYNEGFWGMNFMEGQTYHLSFFTKRATKKDVEITATLQDENGEAIGTATIPVSLTSTWQKVETDIVATGSAAKGRLALSMNAIGNWQLDVVSLFPPTFKGRANGCRQDLAQMLADLKPAFVRFPGGCYVEGQGTLTQQNRFEWKKTIGPIEERPGHLNNNWGYRVSDGMGYQEFLNLCEDLNAEPLFVVNIGLGHGYETGNTEADLQDLVQEALDAIEFANGDTTTTYGHLRALYGHPEPYNLRMLEIGNENNQDYGTVNEDYYSRYRIFREAIKAKYPDMYLIGNVAAWSTDTPKWYATDEVESVDEHYYRSPDWFAGKYHMYDNYDRNAHKVYAGEYAVTSDYGTTGTLKAALGEAIYMLGMEHNSDVVNMASYAPIFVNENNQNWRPDMIRFNSSESFGTPSYYVQQLFPNHVGTQNIDFTLNDKSINAKGRKVGVATWETTATYSNLQWTDAEGNAAATDNAWNKETGTWTGTNGSYTQTNSSLTGARLLSAVGADSEGYTFSVNALKKSGNEGFLIIFDWQDENNYCWWNLGGWSNTQMAIEQCTNGTKTQLVTASNTIETGKTYSLRVEYQCGVARCYINDELALTAEIGTALFANCTINADNNRLYTKVVNYSNHTKQMTINLSGATPVNTTTTVLTARSNYAENTMTNKYNVMPKEAQANIQGDAILYTVPPYSVNTLDIDVTGVKIPDAIITAPDNESLSAGAQYIYSIDGMHRSHLARGLNIVTRKDSNGRVKTHKVLVK